MGDSFQQADEEVTEEDSNDEDDDHEQENQATSDKQLSHWQNVSHCRGRGFVLVWKIHLQVCVILTSGGSAAELGLVLVWA